MIGASLNHSDELEVMSPVVRTAALQTHMRGPHDDEENDHTP